jgi:parvulin-like peptidyl-prolyl isomerase
VTRLRSVPLLLLALVVASSAWLAACSGGRSGVAMTVNGVTLTNDEFTGWLSAFTSSKLIDKTPYASTLGGTYSTSLTTFLLNQQVQFAVVRSEFDRRHLTVSATDMTSAEQQAESAFATPSVDPSTGQQVAGDPAEGKVKLDKTGAFKPAFVRYLAEQTALEKAYAKERGSNEALQKLYDKNRDQFKNRVCVTVLEVPAATSSSASGATSTTPAALAKAQSQAQQLRTSITSVADFTAAAQQAAQQAGSSNGGDLGCVPKGTYTKQVPTLETAIWSLPVGEISQPIEFPDGYLIVRVRARGDLSFDDVKGQLQEAAAQQSVTDYQAWLSRAVKKAEVAVDPQWGSWNAKTGAVVAPVGATSSIGAKVRSTTSVPRSTTSASTP